MSEVARLLQLRPSTIRALVRSGFVTPSRGARRAWLFSFQDLVVLRKAQALVLAKVPHARIVRAMKELRRQAESGQYPLAFETKAGAPRAIGRKKEPAVPEIAPGLGEPVLLYNQAILLEDRGRKKEALEAYRAALRSDPGFADCHYNLGLLYEELGEKKNAIRHLAQYRRLTRSRPK